MSIAYGRQISTYCQTVVLLFGVGATNLAFADEPSPNDPPPPTPPPWETPNQPTQAPTAPQESWHMVPTKTGQRSDSEKEPQYQSKGQMIAGGILIGLGTTSLVGFSVIAAISATNASHSDAEGRALAFVIVGLPLLAGGITGLSIGIPLYLDGSKPPERGSARVPTPPPMRFSVAVAPQSASMQLTF